jgi:adenylate cyclase
MRFRRFQSQLLVFFLGLFTVVQLIGFGVTRELNQRDARKHVAEALSVAGGVLTRQLEDRNTRLLEAGRLLAGDFAFKSAWSTREAPTILSMLENHQNRIGSDWMVLLDLDDRVVADTLNPERTGEVFAHLELLDRAYDSEEGETSGILFAGGRAMQVIILPLMAPLHDAWILIGFELADDFVQPLQGFVRSEISLVRTDRSPPTVYASTFGPPDRQALGEALTSLVLRTVDPWVIEVRNHDFLSLAIALQAENSIPFYALMQRDMKEMLAPFQQLQNLLGLLFLVGVTATAIGTAVLARGVTGPLRTLAEGTQRIAAGDYQQHIETDRKDELGQLTLAFNDMAKGLAERDEVRDLLGKVVSPEIANELLTHGVALGGEDREVTTLFIDCQGFTTFSENRQPSEVLAVLNRTLTLLTELIEAEGGVVDKYIGDAVMALFGAPIRQPDAASRAVRAAVAMTAAMEGRPDLLRIGVGINSGLVVAGNMGSLSRLNYTVIGDNVNLASRLEALTRHYGVSVLVSASTREAAPEQLYREIDRVQVKGRQQPVILYEPLRERPLGDLLSMHEQALSAYRGREFHAAEAIFALLEAEWPGILYPLYRERCRRLILEPPPPNWNGVQRFDSKTGA